MSILEQPAYIETSYYTDLLLNALERKYLIPRKGVHVSDLVGTCPRKGVFTRLDPKRQKILEKYFKNGKPIDIQNIPIEERQLMYFFDGEAVDEKTRKEFTELFPCEYDTSYEVEYGPVIARPDLVDIKRKWVIELKTTDPSADTFLPKMHNMWQLMVYMTILDYEGGTLWYHYITRKKDDGLWREFEIHLSEQARTEIRNIIFEDAQQFDLGVQERNPYIVRHVAEDPTLNKWMCVNYCPYVKQCPEGWAYREQYFKDHPPRVQVKTSVKDLNKKYKP